MDTYTIIEGGFQPDPSARFALLAARFNHFIVDRLVEGALDTLRRHGVAQENITLIHTPGAFEMPLAAKQLASMNRFSAIIALGAVIRGGTPHFDFVANECAKGLAQVMLQYDVPLAFGVLTTDSIEQAIERAGTKAGNKGVEAAMAALEMVNLRSALARLDGNTVVDGNAVVV